jgi:hypothetical protein
VCDVGAVRRRRNPYTSSLNIISNGEKRQKKERGKRTLIGARNEPRSTLGGHVDNGSGHDVTGWLSREKVVVCDVGAVRRRCNPYTCSLNVKNH